MITLSLSAVLLFILKCGALVVAMMFGALIILWPIGDQKVSVTQKVIYGIFSLTVMMIVFGFIQFTA